MNANNNKETQFNDILRSFVTHIRNLLNLKSDTDTDGTVTTILSNIDFRSANAWTLVFAIFIASIGLNTNSTAVIIGAMLISPLMGPIVGSGYALGVQDLDLLKRCLRNLGYAVAIGLTTSTLYFLLSPFGEAQSELIARTRPSFYDVLIAFFGGAAGIVAISRKEKGNAIPGVAIATALMPPLCTAGYGLSKFEFSYFTGAMYLFTINCLFIAIATFVFVRYLKFPTTSHSVKMKTQIDKIIYYVASLAIIPSLFMAWYLHREATFNTRSQQYIQNELKERGYLVSDTDANFGIQESKLEITIIGDEMAESTLQDIKLSSEKYKLNPEEVEIKFSSITKSLEQKLKSKTTETDRLTTELRDQIYKRDLVIERYSTFQKLSTDLTREARVFAKKLKSIQFVASEDLDQGDDPKVLVMWSSKPIKQDIKNIEEFVKVRTQEQSQCCSHSITF